jgi:CubicO group peptidase (beta-lactamase class C family)
MKLRIVFSLILATLAARAGEAIQEPKLADLPEFAAQQLELWHAPGASIAIVRGDEVLAATGFGLRNLKEKLPMTGKTVQPIASISKSFTVASLALLTRDGKLNWDKPVRDYMPEFRLFADYATEHITPRDLVTHATGLPRHDWVWVGSTASRAELVQRLRYLEPSAEPRARYQYNNLAFCTAGYLAGRVAGSSWEELVKTRIFEPLGMASSSFSVDDLAASADHATAYRLNDKDEPVEIRYLNVDSLGPAGAINANAEDISRYLRMYLGKGKFEGREILSEADVAEMTSQRIVVSDSEVFSELGSSQYGMGLRITSYRGRKMVHHGGALRGLSASFSFLPAEKIGVFVAANCSDSSIPSVLTYAVYDRLLGLDKIDWSGRFRARRDKDKKSESSAAEQNVSTRKTGTTPAHALDEYAGDYEHPGYGIFAVKVDGAALQGSFNQARSVFEHYHYEVFAAPKNEASSLSEEKIQFNTSIDGDVESVSIQFEPATKALVFKRKPDARLFEQGFLAGFVGEYEVGAQTGKVALRPDNVLTWSVPGAPLRELEPVRGTRFAMKNRAGFSIEFMKGDGDGFDKIAIHTTSGSMLGLRVAK